MDSDSMSDDDYEYKYISEEEEEEGSQPWILEPTVLIRRSVTATTAEEEDASIASSSASSSMMLSSVAEESMCGLCGRETHAPVDCETLRLWHTIDWHTIDFSGVVLTMPSTLLTPVFHQLLEEVATQWKISPVAAAALLYDVNWDAEQLTTPSMLIRQTNVLRVELASGVSERGRVHRALMSPTTPTEVQTMYCKICMEDFPVDKMVSMPCGHAYCKGCWAGFFTDTLDTTGHCLRLRCPDDQCNERVTEEEIIKSAPELLAQYREQQFSSFLTGVGNGRYARSCPGIGCNYVAVPSQRHHRGNYGPSVPVSCGGCSTEFCFRCGQAPHHLHCQIRNEPPGNEGKCKKCPRCQIRIEKNGGCNHMTCRCGHEFCWLCLEDTRGAHHNHVCGIEFQPERGAQGRDDVAEMFDDEERSHLIIPHLPSFDLESVWGILAGYNGSELQEDAFLVLKKMKEMPHYNYTRYEAHDQGQQYATNQTNITLGTNAEVLSKANAQLVTLRRFLKYSYILSYYFAFDMDENGMLKNVFAIRQAALEQFTEQLSRASENVTSQSEKIRVVDLMVILEKFFDEFFDVSVRARMPLPNRRSRRFAI